MSDPVFAVDIGNTRTKIGRFERSVAAAGLPAPSHLLTIEGQQPFTGSEGWLSDASSGSWLISSVNRPALKRCLDWLAGQDARRIKVLAPADLPLTVDLQRPDHVGMDRLADAVAANRLRHAGLPAVVVDLGSAITVDLISSRGSFLGGAILPGIGMAARAMHEFTDLLPLLPIQELSHAPPPLGKSTTEAMHSGLFWGAVGALRELVARLRDPKLPEQIFVTGGGGAAVVNLLEDSLGRPALYIPHLTLSGIALCAAS